MFSRLIAYAVILQVLLVHAHCSSALGAEAPEFMRNSVAPTESECFEVTGFVALIVPDSETDFKSHGSAVYAEGFEKIAGRLPEDARDLAISVSKEVFRHGGGWNRFELTVDGEKMRYKLYDFAGIALERDVAFDGQTEVQHFADSGYANVFLGRSNIAVPSMSSLYPLTKGQVDTIDWSLSGNAATAEYNGIPLTALRDDGGFVRRAELGGETIVALGWKTFESRFPIPRFSARIRGSNGSTNAIHMWALDSYRSRNKIQGSDLAVPVPAGTTIHRRGTGPSIREYKLKVNSSDIANDFR